MPVLLFSYGTLQSKAVQLASFGRELAGRPDSLAGYTMTRIAATDPNVVALSGENFYRNLEPSPNLTDEVAGTALEITEQELAAADAYEAPSNYQRIQVTLRSGAQAWVYLHA
jgi:gamma-glutamylcyclotransferase (GGCT)/AIG2-like uncharacterized protein YtfP